MRKVIAAMACTSLAASAAAELIEVKLTPGESTERRLAVAPGKFTELCSVLNRGQVILWQFRADPATDFNIHYHVGKQVEYPERREQVRVASGRLAIEIDQTYCWMWTSRSGTVVAVDIALQMRR